MKEFDFKQPDYGYIFRQRRERLIHLRQNPKLLAMLKIHYRDNPGDFITDWGVTSDPRNVERGLPALIPFILFEKQKEFVDWFMQRWKNQEPGLVEKSRELGMSWLTVCLACTICLFNRGIVAGFGSRKEEYVDKKGDPKSLLWKGRQFISNLPKEFRGTWSERKHSPYMRIEFPDTDSVITGESGDGIGRGARASFYIVDEAAWIPRSELIDASLSQTTNCRIDISTPRGMNNSFARKRFGGAINTFTFHWRDDPRKDEDWYVKTCRDIDDPVVVAQEIDLDYAASIEGVLIPQAWINSAINAHVKLGINPSGVLKSGLDVADEGHDKNAWCLRHGILVMHVESWSGKGGDIYETVEKGFNLCDKNNCNMLDYDADGLGAGVRGDARIINSKRATTAKPQIKVTPFRGSGAVVNPLGNPFQSDVETKDGQKGRTNEDFFYNAKAQAWWSLRKRFQMTYRAVVENLDYNKEDIISISTNFAEYKKLVAELGQPTYHQNNNGKIVIDKTPAGTKSPNLADAVLIAFAPQPKVNTGFFS